MKEFSANFSKYIPIQGMFVLIRVHFSSAVSNIVVKLKKLGFFEEKGNILGLSSAFVYHVDKGSKHKLGQIYLFEPR